MAKTTESALGEAVMDVLAREPGYEADVRKLITEVPNYVQLTAEDHEQSGSRPNEEAWEQRVRNLKSHDKTPGNVLAEGFVEHVGKGRYRLTPAGVIHMQNKGVIKAKP